MAIHQLVKIWVGEWPKFKSGHSSWTWPFVLFGRSLVRTEFIWYTVYNIAFRAYIKLNLRIFGGFSEDFNGFSGFNFKSAKDIFVWPWTIRSLQNHKIDRFGGHTRTVWLRKSFWNFTNWKTEYTVYLRQVSYNRTKTIPVKIVLVMERKSINYGTINQRDQNPVFTPTLQLLLLDLVSRTCSG